VGDLAVVLPEYVSRRTLSNQDRGLPFFGKRGLVLAYIAAPRFHVSQNSLTKLSRVSRDAKGDLPFPSSGF
jgi:hypothetical protein